MRLTVICAARGLARVLQGPAGALRCRRPDGEALAMDQWVRKVIGHLVRRRIDLDF